MAPRPRTSCGACRKLKRICVRDAGSNDPCDSCLRTDRECDLVVAPVTPAAAAEAGAEAEAATATAAATAAIEAAKLTQSAAVVACSKRPRISMTPSRPSSAFVTVDMEVLLDVAVRSNCAQQLVRPAALAAARRTVESAPLCSRDATAARAVLHAVAAVGAVSTCDVRFGPAGASNIGQAMALSKSPEAQGSALLPFAYLAMAAAFECGGGFEWLLQSVCSAVMTWHNLQAPQVSTSTDAAEGDDVFLTLPHVARTALALPHRPPPEGVPDPMEVGTGLPECLQCASSLPGDRIFSVDQVLAGEVPRPKNKVIWERLQGHDAVTSVFVGLHAARNSVFDDFARALESPPPSAERLRFLIELCDPEAPVPAWTSILASAVRALCYFQLCELQSAAMYTDTALRRALDDPRCFGNTVLQGTLTVLLNAWRSDLSGAGDCLAELMGRVMDQLHTVVDSAFETARAALPGARFMPSVFVESMALELPADLSLLGDLRALEDLFQEHVAPAPFDGYSEGGGGDERHWVQMSPQSPQSPETETETEPDLEELLWSSFDKPQPWIQVAS